MESRPKRSTRNQKPSYTFKTEEDFFRRTLTEKRKNDIMALIKRDLAKKNTVTDVGSTKHLEKLGGEVRVIPNQLREWLGITDDLTQIPSSSHSSKKMDFVVRAASNQKMLDKMGKDIETIQRQLDDLLERNRNSRWRNQLPDGELMDLEEEIQDGTKFAKPIQEAANPMEELMLIPVEETSSIDEESPMLVESMQLDEDAGDDDYEGAEYESPEDNSNERRSDGLDKWSCQMKKLLGDIKQRTKNKVEGESESGEQLIHSPSSENETADDEDEHMEEPQQHQND